jgi:hypothetical protein
MCDQHSRTIICVHDSTYISSMLASGNTTGQDLGTSTFCLRLGILQRIYERKVEACLWLVIDAVWKVKDGLQNRNQSPWMVAIEARMLAQEHGFAAAIRCIHVSVVKQPSIQFIFTPHNNRGLSKAFNLWSSGLLNCLVGYSGMARTPARSLLCTCACVAWVVCLHITIINRLTDGLRPKLLWCIISRLPAWLSYLC